MTVRSHPGDLPHVEWLDLKGDNVLVECAILKRDAFGNKYFLELPMLDDIDRRRIARILTDRNAKNFELWDLMSQKTLNNGVNALEYFHQVVKVITPEGVVMNPRQGAVGVGRVNPDEEQQQAPTPKASFKEQVTPPPKTTKKASTKEAKK